MGLAKWAARKGAVGGTARWVAKGFWGAFANEVCELKADNFRTQDGLDQELEKMVLFCLEIRFNGDPNHPHAIEIYEDWKDGALGYGGLLGFTEAILMVEAGYHKNTKSNISMFRDIIEEELRKNKIGDAAIFGEVLVA